MKNGARPKSARNHRTHPSTAGGKRHQDHINGVIDALTKFEDFSSKILPALQADVKAGMSTKELREKYASLVQARLITDVLLTEDPSKAAAAGRDLLDRTEGRATERKEVTHKFSEMKEEELDALLKSEITELEEIEQKFEQ